MKFCIIFLLLLSYSLNDFLSGTKFSEEKYKLLLSLRDQLDVQVALDLCKLIDGRIDCIFLYKDNLPDSGNTVEVEIFPPNELGGKLDEITNEKYSKEFLKNFCLKYKEVTKQSIDCANIIYQIIKKYPEKFN